MEPVKKITASSSARTVRRPAMKVIRGTIEKTDRMFDLLGWGALPIEIKMAIAEDVRAYINELEGRYATCDPHVQRRRESVDFWVNSFLEGYCSAERAAECLSVHRLDS
ncbi:MAG: hypothetical protein ACNA78_04780 [Balneolaceae bacterium]